MKFIPYGMYVKTISKILPKCGHYVRRWYVTGCTLCMPNKRVKKIKKIKEGGVRGRTGVEGGNMKEIKKILTTASQMNEEYLCTDVLRPELEAEYRNVANMYKRFKDANILAIIRDGSYLGDIFITQIEKKAGYRLIFQF